MIRLATVVHNRVMVSPLLGYLSPHYSHGFPLLAALLTVSRCSLSLTPGPAGPPPVSYVTDRDDPGGPAAAAFPRLTVITVTAVGALLLLVNIVFVSCYRRRRHLKKQKAGECPSVCLCVCV